MLDEGYTLDGTAQALGWSRQLLAARAKILKLSEAGQQLVGTGEIPVSAIDTLLAIADVSPAGRASPMMRFNTSRRSGAAVQCFRPKPTARRWWRIVRNGSRT
jgi:hypothetical protein